MTFSGLCSIRGHIEHRSNIFAVKGFALSDANNGGEVAVGRLARAVTEPWSSRSQTATVYLKVGCADEISVKVASNYGSRPSKPCRSVHQHCFSEDDVNQFQALQTSWKLGKFCTRSQGLTPERAVFDSNWVTHQLRHVGHWVWLPICNGAGTEVKPATCVSIRFHLFSNGFPIADFGLIHKSISPKPILGTERRFCDVFRS